MEDQKLTITDGHELAEWKDGELTGSPAIVGAIEDLISDRLIGAGEDWLPYGYPIDVSCPHTVYLAAMQIPAPKEIQADPPLIWEDELSDTPLEPDEITAEEMSE